MKKETIYAFIMGVLSLIFSICLMTLLIQQYKELKEYREYYDKTEHLIYSIKDTTILSSIEYQEYTDAFNKLN